MKRTFSELYKKELKNSRRGVFFILTGAIILWQLFLSSKRGIWHSDAIFGLSLLPLLISKGMRAFRS